MRFLLVVVMVSGCGFGVGAVNGPSRSYQNYSFLGYAKDSGGPFRDADGQRWSAVGAWAPGSTQPVVGVALGTRRGWSWGKFGDTKVEGADVTDFHFTGFYRAFSLAVGYTFEDGALMLPYSGGTALKTKIEYGGWFLEPGLLLVGLGPVGVYGTVPIIQGDTQMQFEGQSQTRHNDTLGVRPGLRFAMTVIGLELISVQLTAELRYLMAESVEISGSTFEPASYGGWSSGFAFNVVL